MTKPIRSAVIWEGQLRGSRARVVVAELPAEAPRGAGIFTYLDRQFFDSQGVACWQTHATWCDASPTLEYLAIEGLIDVVGRPEWDTRPRTERMG